MLQAVYNWLVPFVLGGLAALVAATVKHYAKKEKAEAAGAVSYTHLTLPTIA